MAFIDLFKKKYAANVWCNNCNSHQEVQIPKGTSITQFMESATGKCNNCGCNTLYVGTKQINEFEKKPKVKWIIKKEQPIQKTPSYSPRPSNSPAKLLPKPRQQPGAEYAERAKRAEYAERAKRAEYAERAKRAEYAERAKRVRQPNYVEPFFDSAEVVEPRGVFGSAKDIDFWTGLKGEGDENQ